MAAYDEIIKQLDSWYQSGEHERIVDMIFSIPEAARNFELKKHLMRAFGNLGRIEEEIELIEATEAEGRDDARWNYSYGYALFYGTSRYADAAKHLQRAIELGDTLPDTYMLRDDALRWAAAIEAGKEYPDEEEEKEMPELELNGPTLMVILQLNSHMQPVHRAEYYEDKIDEYLRIGGFGYVSGGGTKISEEGEAEYCEIEMTVLDTDEARKAVKEAVQFVLVPKGSWLTYYAESDEEGEECEVGEYEGLAIYLNGTDLPDETYENNKIDDFFTELMEVYGFDKYHFSYWNGPREFALYFYGRSSDEMYSEIESFLQTHPLCEKCRVMKIA